MKRRLLLATALWPAFTLAQTGSPVAPPEVLAAWPQARLQGQALFRYLGLAIYDIALWAPAPVAAQRFAQQELALVLTYRRALSGQRIAERSLDEMARAGPMPPADAQRWLATMRQAFPDVQEGERLTGLLLEEGRRSRFFHQGRPSAELAEAEFGRRFFGIWLAAHSSAPALRRLLLGESA